MNGGDNRLTSASLHGFRLTKHRLVNERSKKDGLSPILAGATNGHVDVVRCLVKNGANINDLNPEGQTPLILAAKGGFHPLLRLLINYGAKLDIQDTKGRTALMHSLMAGHTSSQEIARCLVDAGANQKPADRDGKTALFLAAEHGHVAIVEHLLMDPGADLTVRDHQRQTVLMMLARTGKAWSVYKYIGESQLARIINNRDSNGLTPLLHAAKAGKFSMCSRLIGWGADPTVVTDDDQTIVMLACQRSELRRASDDADFVSQSSGGTTDIGDQAEFVTALLDRGVALDAVDRHGRTALFYAVEGAQVEMVRHLLTLQSSLLKPEARDAKNNSLLHAAARMGRESVVRFLAQFPGLAGFIDEANSDGDSPLRLAVVSKCLRTVMALIESGASLEKANSGRDPPLLCLASECGAAEVVDFLLLNKFDPDSSDAEGVTALMSATRGDHIGIVERLLRASASVNLYSNKGFTALTLAVQTINMVISKLLLEHNADPNLLPEGKTDCKTACSIAATLGNCAQIELLLKHDASAFLRDHQGRNALYYGVLMGRPDPLSCLMKWAMPEELDEYFLHDGQRHTLLTLASEKGYLEVSRLLLLGQASLEAKTGLGESSLHIACRRQDRAMVEMFLTYTLKFSYPRDSDQFTPLMIVCQLGNKDIAMALCCRGVDVNVRTPDGYTALILAVSGCERPIDRVPLLSVLLECGAKFNTAEDERLLGKGAMSLLVTVCKVRSANISQTLEVLRSMPKPPPKQQQQQQQQQAQAQAKAPGKTKTKLKASGDMRVEDRLKMKLKMKLLQPLPDKPDSEAMTKASLAARANKIREEIRSAANSSERSVRCLSNMIKKQLMTCALSDPFDESGRAQFEAEMKHQDIVRLYRRPFILTLDQMDQNRLARDFTIRMDQIRKEVVAKFVHKLDALCRRRPKSDNESIKTTGQELESGGHSLKAAIKRRKQRRVHWRVLYRLKCKSKSAKPSKGFRAALSKRLSALGAAAASSQACRQKWRLPLFWEHARLRELLQRHFSARMRRLAAAAAQTDSELLGMFSAVKLEGGLAVAVDAAAISWAPLPEMCSDGDSSGHEYGTLTRQLTSWPMERKASSTRRRHRQVERLLHQLASDGTRCTLMLRCGRLPTAVKLAMSPEDRERQVDLSWAIHATGFQQPMKDHDSRSRRPDTVVSLSVETGHCLWDPRELRALSDALASSSADDKRDRETLLWHRQCLDTLTRRRTHHLLPAAGASEPRELELVALHPTLATKLVALSLHAKLSKISDVPYALHGDDLLLCKQPGQKDMKNLLGMLGPNRMKLFQTHQFN